MRRAAKVDANQHAIREALKQIGCATEYIKEPVDLLVCFRGETAVMEIKNPDGRDQLTKAQVEFIARWPGKVHVVRTPEEAIKAVIGEEILR